MKNTRCLQCKGTGNLTIQVNENGKHFQFTMGCYVCNSTGQMTPEQKRAYRDEQNMWCRCKKNHGSDFHDDCGGIKHHYTCRRCGKITQVG